MIKFFKDLTGSITVEAALITPMFGAVALGTMDASYLMLQNHRMETQLVIASNYLSKSRNPSSLEAQAKRLAATGKLEESERTIIPGWGAEDITVSYRAVTNSEIDDGYSYRGGDQIRMVVVSSQKSYSGLGIISAISQGSIQITASHEERIVGDQEA